MALIVILLRAGFELSRVFCRVAREFGWDDA